MRAIQPDLSRCPFCRARGVKNFDPLVVDGLPRDVPYCGVCGKNYPDDKPAPPRDNVTAFERGDR